MKAPRTEECRSCCPVANALDVLGDRWTLLVIRDLFRGLHEYREFLSGPEGIATNILSDRLKRLVCCGVAACCPYPGNKTKKIYYLTPKGKDLLPLLVEMILWGAAHRPVSDMPAEGRARIARIRKNPGKFMRDTLRDLAAWEKAHIQ